MERGLGAFLGRPQPKPGRPPMAPMYKNWAPMWLFPLLPGFFALETQCLSRLSVTKKLNLAQIAPIHPGKKEVNGL